MDFDSKMNSKPRKFMDKLYGIVVANFLTILLSIPLITFFSALTTNLDVILDVKENGSKKVFITYFRYFWQKIEKTIIFGILLTVIMVIASFSMYFYRTRLDPANILGQIGYWVMLLIMVVVLLFSLHLPLIIVKFPKLSFMDTLRLSIYVAFRYFLYTLMILAFTIIMVVGVVALPLWIFFGISIPQFFIEKFSQPMYLYLKQIDIENIMKKAREMEDEDDE